MSLKIETILCRPGIMDNYAYIIIDEQSGKSAVVDASEAAPIIKRCQSLNLKPDYILTTHHHFDHVGGNEALKEKYALQVIGPAMEGSKIPGFDKGVSGGDVFELGDSKISVIDAPGHTAGHVLWYFETDKILFTGDVLFNLCVGGLFEGTSEQMVQTLQKIKTLPDDVLFYPGHEYTAHALQDALKYNDSEIMRNYAAEAMSKLAKGLPVAPVRLGVEKQCNPYLLNV